MIGRFKNAAERVLPQLCNIGFAHDDHVAPATLIIIDGYYPDFDDLPGMQARRDSLIGSFSLKHYLDNKPFFQTALERALESHDTPITAILIDDKNDLGCLIAFDNDIDVKQIIDQCTLFSTPTPRPRAFTH